MIDIKNHAYEQVKNRFSLDKICKQYEKFICLLVINEILINEFLHDFGGSESYMFNLSCALEEQGHNVEFWEWKIVKINFPIYF